MTREQRVLLIISFVVVVIVAFLAGDTFGYIQGVHVGIDLNATQWIDRYCDAFIQLTDESKPHCVERITLIYRESGQLTEEGK